LSIGKTVYQNSEEYVIDKEKYSFISVYKMESMQLLREVLSDTYKLNLRF